MQQQTYSASKPGRSTRRRAIFSGVSLSLAIGLLAVLSACAAVSANAITTPSSAWQEDFNLDSRKLSDQGAAKYFILTPGFQIVLSSKTGKLTITVLDETKVIHGITTRVIEEREEINGSLSEVSHNFFAIDPANGDVFYFGEAVDIYSQGQVISHSGAWTAYEGEDKPGLIMPGSPQPGMKYFQEMAPGKAMDRSKVISTSETFTTKLGELKDCLLTQESSKISPTEIEYKTYCPGIGLVQDESLVLESYGNK